MDRNQAAIVVLGVDADGKPHASRFNEAEAATAARAAQLMGFRAVRVEDDALRQLAASLPAGRIFATGRGLVPFVKRELYDKLAGLIGTASELKPEDGDIAVVGGEPTPERKPAVNAAGPDAVQPRIAAAVAGEPQPEAKAEPATDPWGRIAVGSLVLAKSRYDDEGWYEALVTGVAADGDTLSMRWRDYPTDPVPSTHRSKVAVIGPGH